MARSANASLLLKTAEASFWNTLTGVPDPFMGIVNERTTTQKTDTFSRFGAAPMPEEWVGDRKVQPLPELNFSVTSRGYESTVELDKDVVKFDQLDEVARVASDMARKAGALIPSLCTSLLTNGFATAGDDGQFFFDTDHVDPGAKYATNQDNDLTAAITLATAPTAANMATAIRACVNALVGFKDDRGEPWESIVDAPGNFLVLVPPSFYTVTRQVLVAQTIAAAGDNDLQGRFTLRFNQWTADTAVFYVFYSASNHKPIIKTQAGGIEFDSMINDDTGGLKMMSSWWGTVDYGQWRTAVGYTFTTA